jgi:hypothetical protein
MGGEDLPPAELHYSPAPLHRRWRFDLWRWEDETAAVTAASWAALSQAEEEDGRALQELKALVSGQDWTPRFDFSGDGRPAAATGGLWAMGSPLGLVEKINGMEEGDYLLVATDGAMIRVMESVDGTWRAVPQMGGGGGDWYSQKGYKPGAGGGG